MTIAECKTPLSIVVPVYGCSGCLEALVERVDAAVSVNWPGYEIILVDDVGPDRAWPRIEQLARYHHQVRGIRLARNFGQHAAISAGLAESRGAVVVVMDCDLQDRPEEIPNLVGALDADCRVALAHRSERKDHWTKRLGSWAFYRVLGWLTGVPYDHGTANFGAYGRDVVEAVLAMPESTRFFPLLVRWCGYQARTITVQHEARAEGRSGYSIRRLLALALEIALSYSDKPLRVMTWLGLCFAVVAGCFAGYSVLGYLRGDVEVAGFTSIIASIWLIGGLILSGLGMVGLYVGRIFIESKRRPWYVIQARTSSARS